MGFISSHPLSAEHIVTKNMIMSAQLMFALVLISGSKIIRIIVTQ